MANLQGLAGVERALRLVGELLAAEEQEYAIVIVGGSALNLLGVVDRGTTDVDILAMASSDERGGYRLHRPGPAMPAPLADAARTVARDLKLDANWLNTGPESQWQTGLPPGFAERVSWRRYGGLSVGLASRRDLIFLKVYATADQTSSRSVHFQDLIALHPSDEELDAAAVWIRTQDAGVEFHQTVAKVIEHVRSVARGSR